ncbi:hypothetical protein DL93DRAFT_2048797, partial [Clavulina sp. PMI_390]
IKPFTEAYTRDPDFCQAFSRTKKEEPHESKYRAYRIASNGLLYFKDADKNIRLCIPASRRLSIIAAVHNNPLESAHAG